MRLLFFVHNATVWRVLLRKRELVEDNKLALCASAAQSRDRLLTTGARSHDSFCKKAPHTGRQTSIPQAFPGPSTCSTQSRGSSTSIVPASRKPVVALNSVVSLSNCDVKIELDFSFTSWHTTVIYMLIFHLFCLLRFLMKRFLCQNQNMVVLF